ncbi:MAG TPA: hypothetical protein VGB92_06555 [Longimicrobium sp.]|jgi:hypothetical protein
MFVMFMAGLWIVMFVAPVVLLVALLPAGRDCPRCGGETLSIRSVMLRPVRRFLSQRWCIACGWEGTTRNHLHPQPVPSLELVRAEADEADDDAVWRGEQRDNPLR